MKQVRASGVTLISGGPATAITSGAYVTDDFGNLVKMNDDQFDNLLDRLLVAGMTRKLGLPC